MAAVKSEKKPQAPASEEGERVASIPIAVDQTAGEGGYAVAHIEFRNMTLRQRAAAKRIFYSLAVRNARIEVNGSGFPEGRVVNSPGDAMKWVLDRYADEFERVVGRKVTDGMVFDG